jgi:hypothetical protein
MKKLIFILFLLIFTSSAWATVYKWVDERGTVHFSDDLSKVPPDYRNKVEEVNITKTGPSIPSQVPSEKTAVSVQSVEAATQAPSIAQTLIREGDFAVKLADALKIGQAQSEAEAESMLASVGITPKNGWIADYPVTPDIIGELQDSITEAVDSGKLAMKKDEAMKVFQDLIAQQGLPVRADIESQYAGVQPPQNYPDYYEPSAIDSYYYDQGPPIVTYYPPPWDYYYLYAWVPYPFWYTGFWFPGFFILHDFHRVVFVNGHRKFCSNHFWDSRTRGYGAIDPARRHMGNATANISRPAKGFTSHIASNGASSILRRGLEHTRPNRPTGVTPGYRGGGGLSNFRAGVSGVRPPMRYSLPSTGYSRRGRVPFGRPTYDSSFSHSGSLSHPRIGTGRSFSPPSRSGSSGFHSGGFGSRGSVGGRSGGHR